MCSPGLSDISAIPAVSRSGLPGAGVAPANSSWQSYGLRNDDTDIAWDGYFIHGGVYWTGTGSFTFTNGIMEAGAGSGNAWYVFYSQESTTDTGLITFADATVSHTSPDPDVDVAPIWANNGKPMILTRVDSSGLPQGLAWPGGSVIDSCWVHDLMQPRPGNPLHMDGIFSQGGNNCILRNSYIDAPTRVGTSDVTAAVFIQVIPAGSGDTGHQILNNYLSGGSYTVRNETGVGLVCTGNTFGTATFGDAFNQAPGTIGTWTGNVHASDGSPVLAP